MSMYSFQRWASDDFGPVDSRACQIRKAPIIVGSTGPVLAPYCSARLQCNRRVFQSPYGVCTGRHCIRRGTFRSSESRRVHVRVHAILGQNRKNTRRTGRTHVTIASQEGTDFPRTTDSFGSPSLTGRGTPVGLMHAT